MQTIYLLLIFPLVWPFIAKMIWKDEIKIGELAINIVAVCLCTWGMYALGVHSQTDDIEILSGEITKKHRDHDYWLESYQCNCVSVSCGKDCTTQVCQTCFRDHYTVKWWVDTTIGDMTLDYLDRESKSVYNTPDPKNYVAAYVGEPCSKNNPYTNYVKAVPDSLFRKLAATQYDTLVPEYPKIYGQYHINRVLDVQSKLPSQKIAELNKGLNEINKKLGNAKQANIILIVTGIADPYYKYAVESKWMGGKKNDIVLFLGVEGDKIVWSDVMTFGLNKGNELFQVLLRDELKNIGTVDAPKIVSATNTLIIKDFRRTEMKNFEYLKDSIEPPTWGIVLIVILSIIFSVGLSLFFARNDF